ncbi:hypothetical protein GYMLUDRAFT_83859 [Collybiopsis luxurians FD-317 M1]|uniref:Uncharacterized protein n=1 Tax=Collybiopsis luxurians FD-317 M1 TaxID=944289 RepID=A0A0D0CUS2_9AGAR|nr:hypothetical protein GYMLUDRAFT_83859 [Collybiopsis luxurians FD-317 M1]
MAPASQESTCPAGTVCFLDESYDHLVHTLNTRVMAPVVIELTFYGIFVLLFSISMYIFRRRFLPAKFYVIATILFFTLATTSVALALTQTFISPLYPIPPYFHLDLISRLEIALECMFIVSGLLSDVILIYRCYRLWNSKKRVVVVPVLVLVGSLGLCILGIAFGGGDEDEDGDYIYSLYVLTTLALNILLTGLIVGRVWWLNRRTDSIFVGQVNPAPLNLLWPVLLSGIIIPLVLSTALITRLVHLIAKVPDYLLFLVYPCFLIQIVGISSTLMIIFIGFSADGSSRLVPANTQGHQNYSSEIGTTCNESDHSGGSEITQPLLPGHTSNQANLQDSLRENTSLPSRVNGNEMVHLYLLKGDQGAGSDVSTQNATLALSRSVDGNQTVQPFLLKYDQGTDISTAPALFSSVDRNEMVHPYPLKYDQDK